MGAGESLAEVIEVLPFLNELLRDAVLGGDSGGLRARVMLLRADGGTAALCSRLEKAL